MIFTFFIFINFQTNQSGTVVAAEVDESPMLIFSMTERKFLYEISNAMLNLTKDDFFSLSDGIITKDGQFLLFLADYKIPKNQLQPMVKAEDVNTVYVFDLNKRESLCVFP